MLNDLISVVNLYSPKQGVADRWRWRHGENNVYSTKTAYEVLLRSKFSLDEKVKEICLGVEQNCYPESSCSRMESTMGACAHYD
ncbi:hypothetical protein ACS0TY_035042 [Phlomoides rotata]